MHSLAQGGSSIAPSCVQGSLTYTPRAVILDLNGSLGGELIAKTGRVAALTRSTGPVLWGSKLTILIFALLRKQALTKCKDASWTQAWLPFWLTSNVTQPGAGAGPPAGWRCQDCQVCSHGNWTQSMVQLQLFLTLPLSP